MSKVVALVSGGMDSVTMLYMLKNLMQHEVKALSVHYGQRHFKEIAYAEAICERLEVPIIKVDMHGLAPLINKGALMGDGDVPEGHYANESMKQTIVPNRNMIMLSLATGHAIAIGYNAVAYAAHQGDHTIYPDCRRSFVEVMRRAIRQCDWNELDLLVPFIMQFKEDIVKEGTKLGVPYELTWSCYRGGNIHCGKCGTCVERKEAFQKAEVEDPTTYED